MATTRGIARPRACGQVITITVTALSKENAKSALISWVHTSNVIVPTLREMIVSHLAALSQLKS